MASPATVCAAVVLYATSGEKATDRAAESPILDVLQHHVQWSSASNVTAYGLMTAGLHAPARPAAERPVAAGSDPPTETLAETLNAPPPPPPGASLEKWRLCNPCQVGDADASQRHAMAQAVAG